MHHLGIYLSNTANKKQIIQQILKENLLHEHLDVKQLNGAVFSFSTIEKMVQDEFLHDKILIQTAENNSLSTMSSGQQRKALLTWQVAQQPDFMLLDDVYSNVDKATQEFIKKELTRVADKTLMIQIFFRKRELLPFIQKALLFDSKNALYKELTAEEFKQDILENNFSDFKLPDTFGPDHQQNNPLILLKNICVNYEDKQVLWNVNWEINKGEFWQLVGPNGSGKSTLVSMIAGDNPKAYGQNMHLFGMKKGSGETIWDIKKNIGYFTPLMIQRFTRTDSVENMIISGLNDSVGLYIEPTDLQKDMAHHWVEMLGPTFKNKNFQQLSIGQQRMVMVARAMIKQPPLLILDEPTIELDDDNSKLFIQMVNAIASTKKIAIIYISHQDEENLYPDKIFELVKAEKGYTGRTI